MSSFVYDDEMLTEIVEILRTRNRNELADYIHYLAETLSKLDDDEPTTDSEEEAETTDEEYGEEDIGETDDGFFYLK